MGPSRELEDELNGFGKATPGGGLACELAAPGGGELVELGAAPELGDAPLGLHEAIVLEPVERGVERSLIHAERVARDLLDAVRHGPSVHRLARERAEDEEIERALEELVGGQRHGREVRGCCRPPTPTYGNALVVGGQQQARAARVRQSRGAAGAAAIATRSPQPPAASSRHRTRPPARRLTTSPPHPTRTRRSRSRIR